MQEVEGSIPTGGTCPNIFFRSNRPGYPHPVSSELENSGIRVAVGDCSATERRWWRPPYQTGKTVHVHAKHYKHNEDGRTAPGVCGNGSVPLSHSGNVVTRIGIHTHTFFGARRPVPRPWIRSAEVRGGGGGTSLGEWEHNNDHFGRMHGAPYRGNGCVPLSFGGGTSLGEWEHNHNNEH